MIASINLAIELAYSVWTDITEWIVPDGLVVVEQGRQLVSDRVSGVGTLRWSLDNTGGQFTPGGPDALVGWQAGRRVRFQRGATLVFSGYLSEVRADLDVPVVSCGAEDGMAFLLRSGVRVAPIQQAVQSGLLARDVVLGAYRPPNMDGVGIFDDPDFGLYDECEYWDEQAGFNFSFPEDYGASVFTWVRDLWTRDGINTRGAVVDVINSEMGYLSIDGGGDVRIEGRLLRARRNKPIWPIPEFSVLSEELVEDARSLANEVRCTVYPRLAEAGLSVAWSLVEGNTLAVPALGQELRVAVVYRDPDGQAQHTAAWSVARPVAGTDWRTVPPGREYDVEVSTALGIDRGELLIRRRVGADPAAFELDQLQVRGKLLKSYLPAVGVAVDPARKAKGDRVLAVDMPLQNDVGFGEEAARALLALGERGGMAKRVKLSGHAQLVFYEVGEPVRLGDTLDLPVWYVEARVLRFWRTGDMEGELLLSMAAASEFGSFDNAFFDQDVFGL